MGGARNGTVSRETHGAGVTTEAELQSCPERKPKMITTKLLADGVTEIRLTGDDGELDAIVEVTRPAYHASLSAYLVKWQRECADLESAPPSDCRVLPFPPKRIAS